MGAPQGTVCGRTHVCGHHGTGAPGEKCQLRTAGSEDLLRSLQIVKYLSEVSDGGSYIPRKTMIEVRIYTRRAFKGELIQCPPLSF